LLPALANDKRPCFLLLIPKLFAAENLVKEFNGYRSKMNEMIPGKNNLVFKRPWNPDTNTCTPGVLDVKIKELPGPGVRQLADTSVR
jgi:hypothetical protein